MGYRLTSNISTQNPSSDEVIEQRIVKRCCGDCAVRNECHHRDQDGRPQEECMHWMSASIHPQAILVRCCVEPQSQAHCYLTVVLRTGDITFFNLRRAMGFCSIGLATNRASHEHRARITFSVRRARSAACSAEVTVHWLDGRLRRIHFPCHLEMSGGCTCLELRQRRRRFAHR
jgi:hypothetical protein